MKKRIIISLLAVVMLVGLLSITALAGGEGMDKTYATFEQFKEALESGKTVRLSECSFAWPETEETVSVNGKILADGHEWEIPSNITMEFPGSSTGLEFFYDFTLIIKGTVRAENGLKYSKNVEDSHFIIADGGRVEGKISIQDHSIWTVEEGGTLAADVVLYDTLQGAGGEVTGNITVTQTHDSWNGKYDTTATLSGDLDLPGRLSVPYPYDRGADELDYDLIITEGSRVTCSEAYIKGRVQLDGELTAGTIQIGGDRSMRGDAQVVVNGALTADSIEVGDMFLGDSIGLLTVNGTMDVNSGIHLYSGSQVTVNGVLTLGSASHEIGGSLHLEESGILVLPAFSELIVAQEAHPETSGREWMTGRITGTGTIKAYAAVNDNGVYIGKPTFWENLIDTIVNDRAAYADLVEASVTIWRSWMEGLEGQECAHDWSEWTVTKAPTCTEAGLETRTCYVCGETETREIAATGHTWDEGVTTKQPTETEDGEMTYTCTVCGETRTEVIPMLEKQEPDRTGDTKIPYRGSSGSTAASVETPAESQWENSFEDVPEDAYFFEAVEWAVKNNITTGAGAATFAPDAACTRAQAVTFLWRAAGSPAPESKEMPFTDVPEGSYYRDAVLWAIEQNITVGTNAAAFSPDATCTRAQIVTFLWRAEGVEAAATGNPFVDVASDAYYADAVLWAAENGITSGTAAAAFSPDADCTRAQIVTFLWRCLRA